jgi:hypothetical protein
MPALELEPQVRLTRGAVKHDGTQPYPFGHEDRLDIASVSDMVLQRRLRWFRHAKCKDAGDWVSSFRNMAVSAEGDRGSKTWKECVTNDIRQLMLRQEGAQDRAAWRNGILGNRPTRECAEIRTSNQ